MLDYLPFVTSLNLSFISACVRKNLIYSHFLNIEKVKRTISDIDELNILRNI